MTKSDGGAAEELGLGSGFSFGIACWPVYQMLCGMALELLLKGIVVAKGETPKATHRLLDLCAQAGVSVAVKDAGVLEVLSASIVWEGRYPVPKSRQSYAEDVERRWNVLFDPVKMGRLPARRSNDALSWESFQTLWKAIYAHYDAELSRTAR